MINSGEASKRTEMCQKAPWRRCAGAENITAQGSWLLLRYVFYICSLHSQQAGDLSTPQLRTFQVFRDEGKRAEQDGELHRLQDVALNWKEASRKKKIIPTYKLISK